MPLVPAQHPSHATRLWRIAIASLIAGTTGAVAAYIRPRITGPLHYESIVSTLVVLPMLFLVLLILQRRVPFKETYLWFIAETGSVCVVFLMAWFVVYRKLFDDLVGVMAIYAGIVVVAGLLLLYLWQRYRRPAVGPYCLHCGYCLIGTTERLCPECGEPFSLEELGIDEYDLEATAP